MNRRDTIISGTIREAIQRYGSNSTGRKAATIAVMTMMTESGCRVLANANVPVSLKIPHDVLPWSSDGLGHDHASVGSYQQQTGTAWADPSWESTMGTPNGWGTPYELMDPPTAAGKFFHAMDQRDWQHKLTWVVAQDVQGSAFDGDPREANNYSSVYGGNYKGQRAAAILAVTRLWPRSSPAKPARVLPPSKPAKAPKSRKSPKPVFTIVRPGQTLGIIARNFGYGDNWRALIPLNSKRYSSLVERPDYVRAGWKIRVK